jgi:hypothetical protein
MKKLSTLIIVLLSCLLSQAQVKTDVSRVIVGAVTTVSPELAKGLKQARYKVGNYQIALVSARPFTSCYYTIYNCAGQVLSSGRFVKRYAGEYEIKNVSDLALLIATCS